MLVDSGQVRLAFSNDRSPSLASLCRIGSGIGQLGRLHQQQEPVHRTGYVRALTSAKRLGEIPLGIVVASEACEDIDQLQRIVVELLLSHLGVELRGLQEPPITLGHPQGIVVASPGAIGLDERAKTVPQFLLRKRSGIDRRKDRAVERLGLDQATGVEQGRGSQDRFVVDSNGFRGRICRNGRYRTEEHQRRQAGLQNEHPLHTAVPALKFCTIQLCGRVISSVPATISCHRCGRLQPDVE